MCCCRIGWNLFLILKKPVNSVGKSVEHRKTFKSICWPTAMRDLTPAEYVISPSKIPAIDWNTRDISTVKIIEMCQLGNKANILVSWELSYCRCLTPRSCGVLSAARCSPGGGTWWPTSRSTRERGRTPVGPAVRCISKPAAIEPDMRDCVWGVENDCNTDR